MPYLVYKKSDGKPVTYRMYPVNSLTYGSRPADPSYIKDGKWTKPYDPDNFSGLFGGELEKITPENDPLLRD